MALLTAEGERIVSDLAQQYGVSTDAVTTLLMAVNSGYGTQAQFSHPELGGMGQWSQGGMTMVGDMFNNGLKFTVDQLCSSLSAALANGTLFQPAPRPSQSGSSNSFQMQGMQGGSGWPAELGQPASSGSQNNLRYATFPQTRRLAIDVNGQVRVYDTGDHNISGFSQQQSGDQSITFTSQYGLVRVADLPEITQGLNAPIPAPATNSFEAPAQAEPFVQPQPQDPEPAPVAPEAEFEQPSAASVQAKAPPADAAEIIGLIEKLGNLHEMGVLTDSEFNSKKAELLSRL